MQVKQSGSNKRWKRRSKKKRHTELQQTYFIKIVVKSTSKWEISWLNLSQCIVWILWHGRLMSLQFSRLGALHRLSAFIVAALISMHSRRISTIPSRRLSTRFQSKINYIYASDFSLTEYSNYTIALHSILYFYWYNFFVCACTLFLSLFLHHSLSTGCVLFAITRAILKSALIDRLANAFMANAELNSPNKKSA